MSRWHQAQPLRWWMVIFLAGTLHASLYALLVPPWQAPDEPGHYAYACLLGNLGRVPTAEDRPVALEAAIIDSLSLHRFWTHVREPWPEALPASFAADPFLALSGRQIGDEPWLYYLLPALICRTGLPIEAQLRLMRLFGAILFGLSGVVVAWGGSENQGLGNWKLRLRVSRSQAEQGHSGISDLKSQIPDSTFPLLPAAVMVLLPMPAFISASANNDVLALLAGTALFAAVLRIQHRGWRWRRGLGLLGLLAIALLSKKTTAFLAIWLPLLGLWTLLRILWSGGRQRRWWLLPFLAAGFLTLLLLIRPSAAPGSWRGNRQPPGRGLVAPGRERTDGLAVLVTDNTERDFGRLYQNLVGQPALSLRGKTAIASMWVRSLDGKKQPGRLTMRDTDTCTQVAFIADERWQQVSLHHRVALTTTYVKLAVAPGIGKDAAETGSLLMDDGVLMQPGGPNLLRNPGFEQRARWLEPLLIAPVEERWQRFAPRLLEPEALSWASLRRYGLYAALTFPGFWGNFGWLQLPLPLWIYIALAVACAAALLGLLKPGITGPGQAKIPTGTLGSWLLAVLLISIQTFLPMIGRPWQPQGRYLFPALFPIIGLLLVGLDRLLTFDRYPGRAGALLVLLLALDLACLVGVILPAYTVV